MLDIGKEELLKLYNEKILPKLPALEEERKAKFKKYILKQIICVLFAVIFFFPTYLVLKMITPDTEISASIFMYIVPIIAVCISCVDTQTEFKDFSKKLKKVFLKDIFELLCKNENFHITSNLSSRSLAITPKELKRSLLFGAFDNFFYDDSFTCLYKDIKVDIAEVALKLDRANTDYVTEENIMPIKMFCKFSGIVVLFDNNKKINSYTTIKTKGFDFNSKKAFALCLGIFFFGFECFLLSLTKFDFSPFSIFFFAMIFIPNVFVFIILYFLWTMEDVSHEVLKKVNLEDFKFKNKFDVFSEDQVEARYLISPSFMERLYNLKTVFNSKKMRCAFYNDKFMIALETKEDFFELGKLSKSLLKNNMVEKFYNQIKGIYDLIDELEINANKLYNA